MKFFAYSNRATQRQSELVIEVLRIAEVDTLPGLIVIDREQQDLTQSLIGGQYDFGLYRRPGEQLPRGQVPDHIWNLINNAPDDHLIWLAARIVEQEDIHFTWIVAHECGHVRQVACSQSFVKLARIKQRLRQNTEFTQLPPTCMENIEIDSDLLAMQITENIFGKEKLHEFFDRHGIARCPFPSYPEFLRNLSDALAESV
ncbi:hypothetical protein [Sulfurirhabdus autotrophica]|uniref:Uncharacterized protein n=1 Tax=Sulfurirhabdus autotrophica TaxID=1706046 RepID=A0A4R3Y506_9PROT|nr:hypothetical protein [Sulfurirhabdus autotrophica]TCV85888.1 hypothetical protein EDC63_10896 [Sulfurirhabdus autotrophica]